MTRLRPVPDVPPIGEQMADLAALCCELLDGQDCGDLYHVVLSPNEGGSITAHFLDADAMRVWAKRFALTVTREHVAGSVYDLTAAGPVTRDTRTALLRLRATETERNAS